MQIKFTRWCMDPKGRMQVSVDPTRVDVTEHFQDGFETPLIKEQYPSATKIIMRNKQEYIVQGSLDEVVSRLNENEFAKNVNG